jgi:hypothetical protein
MEKESLNGLMEINMLVISRIIKCNSINKNNFKNKYKIKTFLKIKFLCNHF